LRASAAAERAGYPSVTVVSTPFRKQAAVVAKGGSVSFEVLRFLVIDTAKSYLTAAACVTCWSTVVLDSLIIEAQTRR